MKMMSIGLLVTGGALVRMKDIINKYVFFMITKSANYINNEDKI